MSAFRMRPPDDYLLTMYSTGRLGFKEEGAGKVRVFAIPNAFNLSGHYFVPCMIGLCRS